MKLLLKQVLIVDPHSPYNGLTQDILIENGFIKSIDNDIDGNVDRTIAVEAANVSAGWVDVFTHFSDPGFEYKETLETGANAAAAGGFVHVFALPNTMPVIGNKAQVEYVVQKSKNLPINVYPLASITKNLDGKELAEMYDMANSGAIAFTDGLKPVQTPGLFLKALQYVKAFDGVLIQLPVDTSIGSAGLMNEGITSTRLGLQGIPEIAEELIVARDIELAKYTDSHIHITGVTTAKSIDLIKQAKETGINITCSVTAYHLYFSDEDLSEYDTNLKVNPPLRNKQDVDALRKAVEDGIVDCIASHHLPQDWDNKVCEFEYARPGMINLQTSFNVFNTIFPHLPVDQVAALFSSNLRRIFKLPQSIISEGNVADLTLFTRVGNTTFTKEMNKSKSANSPFFGVDLKGKVLGVINKEKVYLNE
jgi:dihydroorotase